MFFFFVFFPLPLSLSSVASVAVSKYLFERFGAFISFSTEIVNKLSMVVADLCVRKTFETAEDVSRSFTRAESAQAATDASVLKSLTRSLSPSLSDNVDGSLLLLSLTF